jgi:LytR cell envelope-related transcriptional attenuator
MRRHGVVLIALLVAAVAACHPGSSPAAASRTSAASWNTGTSAASGAAAPTLSASRPSPTVSLCQPGSVFADLHTPDRAQVKVRVLSGGAAAGTARAVATQFRDWRMQVVATGTDQHPYAGLVTLRYGPLAVGAAWTLRPFFMVPDRTSWTWTGRDELQLDRQDDIVDVVLGMGFQQLNTTTEVNQATAVLGRPTAPPGTCALD